MKDQNTSIGRRLRALGVLIGMLSLSITTAQAEDVPAAPLEERLQLCGGCHNPDGNSVIPENPKLSGLHVKYLKRQLEDFKSGDRASPVMSTIIPMVNEDEFKDLAKFFSEQKRVAGTSENAELVAKGKQIYEEGVMATAAPACGGCHGADGAGNDKFPRLGGQNQPYVVQQLQNFKTGARTNDPKAVMRAVAKRLTDEEMVAVAEYIVTLKEAE